MKIKKYLLAVLSVVFLAPLSLKAQDGSSVSIFSPYTIYGIGNINSGAPSFLRAMGSAGVAFGSSIKINYLNPATNSYVVPNTFLLSFGGEGGGYYLTSESAKTSSNTFNMSDIALRFPVAKGWGVSLSLTPYSSVGYSISELDDLSYSETVDYNAVYNYYTGEGSVSQLKLGVGGRVFKNFSLGVDLVYYLGTINRSFGTSLITNNSGSKSYNTTYVSTKENVSSFTANFGAHYDILFDMDRSLSLGATYLLGGVLNSNVSRVVYTNNDYEDLADDQEYKSNFTKPDEITVGATYRDRKTNIVLDYKYSAWAGTNDAYEQLYSNVDLKFTDTHSLRVGGEYTPNRYSVRNFMSKISYRLGANVGNSYMKMYDTTMWDTCITMGAGVPIKQGGISSVNISLELGQTGVLNANMFKQQYFKVSVGVSLFGDDYWFVKQKYN
ncbi:MAG: hypothetical protein R3Y38_03130 [Rikenellaceae bacterium]